MIIYKNNSELWDINAELREESDNSSRGRNKLS